MIHFALVTEGVTDYLVLKPIIRNFFNDTADVTQIRPEIDDTEHEIGGPGGFRQVLSFCKSDGINEILKENDFVVIQIDSDISNSREIGIPHTVDDVEVDPIDLYDLITTHLTNLFPHSVVPANLNKIIYAIGIHSIECWLIPVLAPKAKNVTSQCLSVLNDELLLAGYYKIPKKRKNSVRSKVSFAKLTSAFTNKREITRLANYNVGFKKFVESLNTIPVDEV